MSDETRMNESNKADEHLDARTALIQRMNDLMMALPASASISRDLGTLYAVYAEDGTNLTPPPEELEKAYFGAIVALEARIAKIEERLGL